MFQYVNSKNRLKIILKLFNIISIIKTNGFSDKLGKEKYIHYCFLNI